MSTRDEASIQAKIRLHASTLGWRLWRNNVGVLMDSRGIPVRFGLANDSKGLNHNIKSGDLIGVKPVLITQAMVGTVIGQFVSVECKHEGWKFNPKDAHEAAQMKWSDIVNDLGGYAIFSTGSLK